jgi:hypothetical protein
MSAKNKIKSIAKELAPALIITGVSLVGLAVINTYMKASHEAYVDFLEEGNRELCEALDRTHAVLEVVANK